VGGGAHAALAERLIPGILILAALAYGAVEPWASAIVHWATLGLLVLTVLRWASHGDVALLRGWINLSIGVLAFSVLLSTTLSIYRFDSIREATKILNYLMFFYLVFANLRTEQAIVRCLTVLVVAAALLPLAGALQDWTRGAGAGGLTELIFGSFQSATFPNENHFAAFLTLLFPVGLGLAGYLFRARRRTRFGVVAAALIVMATAIMETLSRAAWMGTVAGLLAMTAALGLAKGLSRELKLQAAAAAVFTLLLVAGLAPAPVADQLKSIIGLGTTPRSMEFRTTVWTNSLPIVRDHALSGAGPGAFSLIFTRYRGSAPEVATLFTDYAHNDYLQYAVEMGLPAVAGLIGVFVSLIYGLGQWASRHSTSSALPLVLGITGAVVAFGVVALYSFEFYVTANGMLFWGVAGVAMSMIRQGGPATSSAAVRSHG
jgi:O-antigen ligase